MLWFSNVHQSWHKFRKIWICPEPTSRNPALQRVGASSHHELQHTLSGGITHSRCCWDHLHVGAEFRDLPAEYKNHRHETSAYDPEKPKDIKKRRIMEWIMSIHTCNIASAIPASTTVPSAPSATFAVSAWCSVDTKAQNMWAKEVANYLHSISHLWIWHFNLLAVFYIENLIIGAPTSWRQAWISGKASCTRSSSLYIQYTHWGLKEEM